MAWHFTFWIKLGSLVGLTWGIRISDLPLEMLVLKDMLRSVGIENARIKLHLLVSYLIPRDPHVCLGSLHLGLNWASSWG